MDAALEQLETEIQKITEDRQAYDRAITLNPSYVQDRRFRLKFLRDESYDPKAAAETLVLHFVVKHRLFGSGEILARDVKLSDLSTWDRGLLELGFTQILLSRDAAGRSVVVLSPEYRRFGTRATLAEPIVSVQVICSSCLDPLFIQMCLIYSRSTDTIRYNAYSESSLLVSQHDDKNKKRALFL